MNDWLGLAIRIAIVFPLTAIAWYFWLTRKMDIRKNPEIVEETNKKRVADGKPPLTAGEIVKILKKEAMLHSLFFALCVTIGTTLGGVLVDWGMERFFR